MSITATAIFIVTYTLIALGERSPRKIDRPTAALLGSIAMVAFGVMSRSQAASAIDFSTLALLFGMMVMLAVLNHSHLPEELAFRTLLLFKSRSALLAGLVLFSGIASAFMLNDTICLLATPILISVLKRAKLPAMPYLMALATSANIGSVMTLTGNPQNMIIGHASGISWTTFLTYMAPTGLVCLFINWVILCLIYRADIVGIDISLTHSSHVTIQRKLAIRSVICFTGFLIAIALGIPMDFAAVTAATLLLVWANCPPQEAFRKVDWSLLLFFAGLFVVVEGVVLADKQLMNKMLLHVGSSDSPTTVVRFSMLSLIGSNIFSNVPFVLIASHWVRQMSDPKFYWLLLALVSTFAGNLTLLGSVANLIVAQRAHDYHEIRFGDYLKAGIPITIVTTVVGILILIATYKLL